MYDMVKFENSLLCFFPPHETIFLVNCEVLCVCLVSVGKCAATESNFPFGKEQSHKDPKERAFVSGKG